MIRELTSLIRRIVGRLKKYMKTSELYAMMGTVSYPLGVTLIIVRDKLASLGVALATIGVICFIVATLLSRNEEKQTRRIEEYLIKTIEIIKDEIKGLRQDLKDKGGDNDTRNKPTDKV
jgi:hypothetical protein